MKKVKVLIGFFCLFSGYVAAAASSSDRDVAQAMVESAGQSMSKIKGALDESIAPVSFIPMSLQEQRVASDQVASNVERVAQSVEENAATQGGIVRTTQELKAMSDGQGGILQRFSL